MKSKVIADFGWFAYFCFVGFFVVAFGVFVCRLGYFFEGWDCLRKKTVLLHFD